MLYLSKTADMSTYLQRARRGLNKIRTEDDFGIIVALYAATAFVGAFAIGWALV